MLPFLKNKNVQSAGVVVKTREPDEKPEQDQYDSREGVKAAASALINAVHSKNVEAVADAIEDLIEMIQAAGSDEKEEMPEPHSYEAQLED